MVELTAALTKPNGLVPQFGDNDSARVHKLPFAKIDESRDHSHLAATAGELLNRPDLRLMGARANAEANMIAGDLRGRVPPPVATRNDSASQLFADTGWAVVRNEAAWLAVTCGANGMGGRGGHGHNDKNSFELNVGGLDFIVDGGCPAYSSSPETRNRYRGTAAHNTVAIVGEEQDRWEPGLQGLFKLVERSAPRLEMGANGQTTGSHTGFGPIHRRNFRLAHGCLDIFDHLDDERERWIIFNLDPEVSVYALAQVGDQVEAELRHKTGQSLMLTITAATAAEIGLGAFGVGYGQPVSNVALKMRMTEVEAHTRIRWVA